MKRIAILQSNYIPWKGYFDIIASVDEFVLYDEVQFTKNDWRNRNRIKTRTGVQWLSIPVRQERLSQAIDQIRVADGRWATKHWNTLAQNYARARYFKDYAAQIEQLYGEARELEFLSAINALFIRRLCGLLGVTTRITPSGTYALEGDRVARLVGICRQAQATTYLSGPSARGYIDEQAFAAGGVGVEWMDYSGYPVYGQPYPPFEHGVSVVDLLFNCGPLHREFMKRR